MIGSDAYQSQPLHTYLQHIKCLGRLQMHWTPMEHRSHFDRAMHRALGSSLPRHDIANLADGYGHISCTLIPIKEQSYH